MDKNLSFLKKILGHFTELCETAGMISLNMGEVYNYAKEKINKLD